MMPSAIFVDFFQMVSVESPSIVAAVNRPSSFGTNIESVQIDWSSSLAPSLTITSVTLVDPGPPETGTFIMQVSDVSWGTADNSGALLYFTLRFATNSKTRLGDYDVTTRAVVGGTTFEFTVRVTVETA